MNLSPDITPAGTGSVDQLWEAVAARVDGDTVTYDFGEEGRATGQVGL